MNKANKLLMMFIVDGYKSQTGKISKKTAVAMMGFVRDDKDLQRLLSRSDYKAILKYEAEEGATIAQQTQELEQAKKRIESLEKAGEDLFHSRITGDDMWAITCGLQLSDTHPSNNHNTKGDV